MDLGDATAVDLNDDVRNQWGIENKSHYVRDTVWHEDAQHVNNGTAPHVKATLANTANVSIHGVAVASHAAVVRGGIQGLPVTACSMASMAVSPWLTALVR